MKPLGDTLRHYWLAQRMAKEAGLDLALAQDRGLLPQREWAAMVRKCRGCEWADGCTHWLETQQDGRALPDACANSRTFAALQSAMQKEA